MSAFLVLLYRFIPVQGTFLMIKRSMTNEGVINFKYTPIHKISPYLQVCAMASEDQQLPFHSGIDIDMIVRATKVNQKGKKVFGASTISQQVAKNIFLFPNRSYLRKILELYFTIWIETMWSKSEILEKYLNVAEMGPLVFGHEAAANYYFAKRGDKLSLDESALLISVLPSPLKYKIKPPSNYIQKRKNDIKRLYRSLDGAHYLRELYVRADDSLYDFSQYKSKK